MPVPSFKEDHISQLHALKLLMNKVWQYISSEQGLEARGGRTSNELETILKDQLHKKRLNEKAVDGGNNS